MSAIKRAEFETNFAEWGADEKTPRLTETQRL